MPSECYKLVWLCRTSRKGLVARALGIDLRPSESSMAYARCVVKACVPAGAEGSVLASGLSRAKQSGGVPDLDETGTTGHRPPAGEAVDYLLAFANGDLSSG